MSAYAARLSIRHMILGLYYRFESRRWWHAGTCDNANKKEENTYMYHVDETNNSLA